MEVYYINLDRQPERRTFMEEQFATIGLKAHRVPAVDGQRFRAETRRLSADGRYVMSRLQICNNLSHRRVWRLFLRTGGPCCTVLEDDVHLGEGFAALMAAPGLEAPGFDVIKLETLRRPTILATVPSKGIGDRQVVPLLATHHGNAGYVITRQAAIRLLQATRGAPRPMDWLLFDPAFFRPIGIRVGQLAPAIVIQHEFLEATTAGALASQIDGDRGGWRGRPSDKRGVAKLAREAIRPFRQLASWAHDQSLRLTAHGGARAIVPFR
jgi:glycosyl transferase family 25